MKVLLAIFIGAPIGALAAYLYTLVQWSLSSTFLFEDMHKQVETRAFKRLVIGRTFPGIAMGIALILSSEIHTTVWWGWLVALTIFLASLAIFFFLVDLLVLALGVATRHRRKLS